MLIFFAYRVTQLVIFSNDLLFLYGSSISLGALQLSSTCFNLFIDETVNLLTSAS